MNVARRPGALRLVTISGMSKKTGTREAAGPDGAADAGAP